jgi:hypothetical protein
LAYGPFDGDRDVDVRLLRDVFVRIRYPQDCQNCLQIIPAGTRSRARTEVFDGEVATFYFCKKCCDAMARSWYDGGEAMEKRYEIGYRAGASPGPNNAEKEGGKP